MSGFMDTLVCKCGVVLRIRPPPPIRLEQIKKVICFSCGELNDYERNAENENMTAAVLPVWVKEWHKKMGKPRRS